ncbi:MAG: PAC2 family protein [Candidatus Hadarchaeota archaeon]
MDRVSDPIFVEGLLGVGQVGLLASDYLVEEIESVKVGEVYSPHFSEPFRPGKIPGVVYSEEGMGILNRNEIFFIPGFDLFVYKGLYQGDYCEFYYRHANLMMDFCEDFKVNRVFTLGGLGVGMEKDEPNTRAVITDPVQETAVEGHASVLKREKDRPGVTGLSGLLIGLAHKNDMEGISLLGETQGAFPDARAAKSVLTSLTGILGIDVDLSGLDERAEEIDREKEKFRKRMKSMQRGERGKREPGDKRYVG